MLQIKKLKFSCVVKQVPVISSQCRSIYRNQPSGPFIHPNPLVQPLGTTGKFKRKHINPKFKLERGQKVMKVDLPDFHEKKPADMSDEEMRLKMKEMGLQPPRRWAEERPLFISCTGSTFEPYVPPEGDGKASFASKEGLLQNFDFLGKKGRSYMAVRKIRQYDDDFEYKDFIEQASKTYIKLHESLAKFDEDELHRLATEKAYPILTHGVKNKTIRWAFHGSIEPARVVLVRQTNVLEKSNIFAQITVRLHTQQTLAVYDRFGRLIHGSESVLRDVLEYVVFEKHISNLYGMWRIHDKIIPAWMNLKPTSQLTFRLPSARETAEETQIQTPEAQIQQS